jgi:hypothetical protein
MVTRTNQKLWEKIKKSVHKGSVGGKAGTWNARKAQLAVKKYKNLGGKYKGGKSPSNSLSKWTREKWDYIDGKKGNRYLPEKIRKSLSRAQKSAENRRKRSATKKGQRRSPYTKSVRSKMRSR